MTFTNSNELQIYSFKYLVIIRLKKIPPNKWVEISNLLTRKAKFWAIDCPIAKDREGNF